MFPEGRIVDFLIVAVVALIVVGPQDLPRLMRVVGQFTAKLRAMAAEFRASFDEMARQSELDELRREVAALKNGPTAGHLGLDADTHATLSDFNAELTASAAAAPADYQYPARVSVDPQPADAPRTVETEALAAKAAP